MRMLGTQTRLTREMQPTAERGSWFAALICISAMISNLSSWEIFDILGRYSKGSGLIYVEWFRTPAGFGIDIRAAAAVNVG